MAASNDGDASGGRLADEQALRALSFRYAAGLDRRDLAMYLDVFEPDGVFEMFERDDLDTPLRRTSGHDEMGGNLRDLERLFRRTMHLVGNSLYEFHGDEARGEVYCVAHHLGGVPPGGTDYVMYIRYYDTYVRGSDGEWRIRTRRLVTEWTESLAADT
jgi:hypothetical protein